MYFEEEIQLPALVPIKINRKKKTDNDKEQGLNMQDAANAIAQEFIKYQNDRDGKKP